MSRVHAACSQYDPQYLGFEAPLTVKAFVVAVFATSSLKLGYSSVTLYIDGNTHYRSGISDLAFPIKIGSIAVRPM